MKRSTMLLILAPALSAPLAAFDADAVVLPDKANLHIYLLIGQSNMDGRGALEANPGPVHPRVLMLSNENRWTPAVEPLDSGTHRESRLAGAGLGVSFARSMADTTPDATIALVSCAVGGTPLSRWQKGGDLYRQALARVSAAMPDGTIKGVLWHQGESDAVDPELAATYALRLAAMIADLRADLALPDLPFVAGKLGEFLPPVRMGKPYHWKTVNAQLAGLPGLAPRVAVVESAGLTDKGDAVHFDTPALRTLGIRYADAMRTLMSKSAALPEPQASRATLSSPLLSLTPEAAIQLERAQQAGLIEIAPVHLPTAAAGDCDHFGWPIATLAGDVLVVMHRRIPGHRATGAGKPDPTMSYGVVLRSEDGGKTWSEPYDLRDCMKTEDRERGGLVPLSHRAKFDPENKSERGYKVHLHSIGATRDGGVVAINNHGVFRSDDAGRTWRHFSTALRDDTFPGFVNLGPNLIDHPQHGLLAFGNWFGANEAKLKKEGFPRKLVALRSRDGGASWQIEEHDAGFQQYEPAALLHDGRLLFVSRDQTETRAHKQMSWQPGQTPQVIDTNLKDPQYVDTVDFGFNPVTKRFEVVRSERYRMELWLWSMNPADWDKGQWIRECRLLGRAGEFYSTADGFHPAGAVIDAKRGVQHIFIYAGHPNGPAGVFRITRTLDTPKLTRR